MALIKAEQLIKKEAGGQRLHSPVNATYFIFSDNTIDSKQKVLQIDTYGSVNRVHQGKTSQSIQLDYEAAKKLYDILTSEFGFNN